MDLLSKTPKEVLYNIFRFIDLGDLRRLSCSGRDLHKIIQENDFLWNQQIYLACVSKEINLLVKSACLYPQDLEMPRPLPEDANLVLRRLRPYAELLTTTSREMKQAHMLQLVREATILLSQPELTASALSAEIFGRLFDDESNKSAFLWRCSLFRHACQPLPAKYPESTPEEAELSAKLAVFYGMSLESGSDDLEVHPYARARIYDLRRYTEKNGWGPFKDVSTGEVDWERVLAIMVDLGYNLRWVVLALRELAEEQKELSPEQRILSQRANGAIGGHPEAAFAGVAPNSFQSIDLRRTSIEPRTELDEEDPYGVTGTWMRLVCFLDWMNLQHFNFGNGNADIPENEDREPCNDTEAIRMIVLKLRVIKIAEPEEEDHPSFPVVHFSGTSRSMHMAFDPNTNSRIRGRIRGTVRTTKCGSIRWTTFSIYHGEERWRSEGVQIGGIQSARGILGTWFDKDYDSSGPAGPTAFWKLSNDLYVEPKMQ